MKKKRKLGWFYAAIRKRSRRGGRSESYYEIHEVFPWGPGGKLMWTAEPVAPMGNTLTELRHCLTMMLEDSFRMPLYRIAGRGSKKHLVKIKRDSD